MKKTLLCMISVVLAVVSVFSFSACDLFDGCGEEKTYVIQYTYDGKTYQQTVTKGQPYAFDTVPEKKGYEFLGLYDAETGGTQYVNKSGASVGTFSGKQGMVLYPQFKACEYTLVLDYQGGEVSGARQLTAQYDSPLPALPKDVALAHKVFLGWYTEENCGGIKVADKDGLVPLVSVVNYDNFDLDTGIINLYAGFEAELFTVTLNFGTGTKSESIKVEYDTPVDELIYSTRVNGQGVLSWSQTQGGGAFTGNITSDTDLYALSFAPVIELDGNGIALAPYVAVAGSTLSIPEPKKPLSDFLYWETENGQTFTGTVMPEEGFKLKAVWQPKIVFDANGGTEVFDISEKAGTAITLPTPTREGYVFAGWFTQGKGLYTSGTMPAEGVALKAGWYVESEKTITLIESNWDKKKVISSNSLSTDKRIRVDLSDIFPEVPANGLKIGFSISFKWGNTYKNCSADGQVALYQGSELNSAYRLGGKTLSHGDDVTSVLSDSINGVATINQNVLYVYYAGAGKLHISLSGGYGNEVLFYDMSMKLTYPDTSTLYL